MSDDKTPLTKKKSSARGLGRGLSALMADISLPDDKKAAPSTPKTPSSEADAKAASQVVKPEANDAQSSNTSIRNVQFISIARLTRNPDQPRKMFDQTELDELTESIRTKGVLQPILVRPLPDSQRSKKTGDADFQIVAGERRWQASMKAGLESMPVLIRDLTDREVLEIGVVENVQRSNLTPMEEARAYRALMNDFGRTQADVADAVGKSRPHVANLMKFLDLPLQVQRYLELGRITMGHGRAIANVPNPTELSEYVIEQGLSVRATEKLAKELREGKKDQSASLKEPKTSDIIHAEADLVSALGLTVDLRHKGPTGELRIKYRTLDQLEDLMRRLKG